MKTIKYTFVLLSMLSLSLVACSSGDDDSHDYYLEYAPVIDAEVPSEFQYGDIYNLKLNVALPNSCYFFYNQYDYFHRGNERYIYPIAHVDVRDVCNEVTSEVTLNIPVKVLQAVPYVFKFYQGKNADGKDDFLRIEVPVIFDQDTDIH